MNGCKLVKVGDSLEKIPRQVKVMKSTYQDTGSIPVIDQGKDYIAGYTDDPALRYDGPLPLTIFGDHTRILKWVDRPFAVGADGTQLLRGDHRFDQRYFYYALCSLELEHFGYERHFKYLKEEQIPVPPLPTQRRIAGILSAYDDLIENNLRRIKILEEMAQSLYREWFVHFRFPGHESVKLVDSPLGKIPEGWEVRKLCDTCRLTMGQSPKSEFYNETGEGTPFHQGVTNFGNHFPSDRLFCTVDNRVAEHGDILFSVRAPVGRINVADKRIVIGRGVSAIRAADGYQDFLYFQLKHLFQEENSMGNGAIFNAVTKSDMQAIDLLLPQSEWIEHFELTASPVFKSINNLTSRNQTLRRTRDLLFPKLLDGFSFQDILNP